MATEPVYEVKAVQFSYGAQRVLDRISFALNPGAFHGIVGPNGCGKTTLLDIMIGVKRPQAGLVRYQGKDIFSIPKRAFAREVALVPQDYRINFAFTVEEVVFMGRHPYMGRFSPPTPEDRQVVERVMERLGIAALRNKFITQLSGGERQRVVFARALAQDTGVILLDEATSNMDIYHTVDCLSLVKRAVSNEGKTAVATFHDLNSAALFCDNLFFMKHGRIVVHGSIEEVFTEEVISRVFGVECLVMDVDFAAAKQVVFRAGGIME